MSRENAINALMKVTENKGYNNLVLKNIFQDGSSKEDRAFLTEVVNGCLRNLIYLDYLINQISNTKTDKLKPFILSVLRVSFYQIEFMDKVPDYAVCQESAEIVKKRGYKNLVPFVNGVLRNFLRKRSDIKLPDDKKEYLCVKYSFPRWIVDYFLSFLSFDDVKDLLHSFSLKPSLTIAINTLKTDSETLKESLEKEGVKIVFSSDEVLQIEDSGDLTKLKSFKEGHFFVMDLGAFKAIDALNIVPNSKVLDMCAAPGGKSFLSAIKMKDKGEIVSCDIFDHKINLINETKNRLGLEIVKPVIKDGNIYDENYKEAFDYVIVDSPCSGLGLLRKKPDIKYTKTFEDILSLLAIQKTLLENGSKYVKKDGFLLFATCTISKRENEDNVVKFLENNTSFKLVCQNLLLPKDYNGDGFFIAIMQKI